MDFEFYEETQTDAAVPEEFPTDEAADDFPPSLENKEDESEEYPPSFGRIGESVEHRAKRHELETDMKNGNEIAVLNSYKELKKIEEKEAKAKKK